MLVKSSAWKGDPPIGFLANDRCNQENLIAQLKSVRALSAPVDLVSSWACMVQSGMHGDGLAGLDVEGLDSLCCCPRRDRWATRHKAAKQPGFNMDFTRFLNAFMRVPCQIVRQAG